jgi:hypothetical protein
MSAQEVKEVPWVVVVGTYLEFMDIEQSNFQT